MPTLAGPLFAAVGVLLAAGVMKCARPTATATALRAMRVPAPVAAARALGIAEVAIAVAAIVSGHAVAWAAVTLVYGAFAVFVVWALGTGAGIGSCGCFGREDTPPTPGHAAFNASAAALAALAVLDPVSVTGLDLGPAEAVLFVALVGIGVALSILALTALPRTLALARGTASTVPAFTLSESDRRARGRR